MPLLGQIEVFVTKALEHGSVKLFVDLSLLLVNRSLNVRLSLVVVDKDAILKIVLSYRNAMLSEIQLVWLIHQCNKNLFKMLVA